MSITVTLLSVSEISSTMSNMHKLLQLFVKHRGKSLDEVDERIEAETSGSWTKAEKTKGDKEYGQTNSALYQIVYLLIDDSIRNLQKSAAGKYGFNGIDLLKHMFDDYGEGAKSKQLSNQLSTCIMGEKQTRRRWKRAQASLRTEFRT